MSGKRPKRKGDRAEREVVKRLVEAGLTAKRVPLSGNVTGYPGDVCVTLKGRELCLEVKARKDFKTLYDWLEHRDGLILKADRKEPLIVMRLNDLLAFREGGDSGKPEPRRE